MGEALDLLLVTINAATSQTLVDTHRLSDAPLADAARGDDVEMYNAIVTTRTAISNELQARFPHVVDEWCARLDAGGTDDLLDLYLQEMNK